jgi:hypothetical protein
VLRHRAAALGWLQDLWGHHRVAWWCCCLTSPQHWCYCGGRTSVPAWSAATVNEACVFPHCCCSVINVPESNISKPCFLSEFFGKFRLLRIAIIALNASQADSCSWTCIPNSHKKVDVALVLPCGLHGTSMPTWGPYCVLVMAHVQAAW